MVEDKIADMLTRIRNANQLKYDTVEVLGSKTTEEIAKILKAEGFIADYVVNKASNGNTITSLDDAYLVYSSIIKNSVFYDSVTKEVIDVDVNVSKKKEGSADFNYVVSAEGYENLSGSVKFEYSSIGVMNIGNNIQDDVEVTLPDEYSVSLLEVPTVIPSRPRISLEDSTVIAINYQTYYSIDEGKTWLTEAPKINEAGTYNIYTLYCFVDSGNDATALVDGDISTEANSSLAASGNFIINVQTITVE